MIGVLQIKAFEYDCFLFCTKMYIYASSSRPTECYNETQSSKLVLIPITLIDKSKIIEGERASPYVIGTSISPLPDHVCECRDFQPLTLKNRTVFG